MKIKPLTLAILTSLIFSQIPLKVWAQTVLENVEKTGILKVGARKDAAPFGFVDQNGQWQGYSVDLIHLIHHRLEQELGKPVQLQMEEVTVDNRFEAIEDKKVDLVCEATTVTQERLEKVGFSVPFFMSGSQFLVKTENISKIDLGGTLENIAIAYIPNTTTDTIIRQIYPFADWQPISNRQEGLQKLNQDQVMAVASDGILLIAEVVGEGQNLDDYALMPRVPMTTELYACMLPKNDSTWKTLVDQTIVSPDNRELQQKWFNLINGTLPDVIRIEP